MPISWNTGSSGGGIFQGNWNALTNIPVLIDGVGTINDYYVVNVAGTRDLGHGIVTFTVSDQVWYSTAGEWIKVDAPSELWQKTGTAIHPIIDGDDIDARTGGWKDNDVITTVMLGDSSNTSFNTTNKTIIGAVNELFNKTTYRETFIIDATDLSNKFVTLSNSATVASIDLKVKNSGDQLYGYSYFASGNNVSWNGMDLEGELVLGSIVSITYTSTPASRETFVLDAADILAKKVTLSNTPYTATSVDVKVKNSSEQIYGYSYILSGDDIAWNTYDLQSELVVGSILSVTYTTVP